MLLPLPIGTIGRCRPHSHPVIYLRISSRQQSHEALASPFFSLLHHTLNSYHHHSPSPPSPTPTRWLHQRARKCLLTSTFSRTSSYTSLSKTCSSPRKSANNGRACSKPRPACAKHCSWSHSIPKRCTTQAPTSRIGTWSQAAPPRRAPEARIPQRGRL
jgi:hypothetical protein